MAQLQTKTSFWRRFFGWFGRHKITAVFTVLCLASVLYVFYSWVVLEVQIHNERDRFVKTDQQLTTIAKSIPNTDNPTVKTEHSCSYTSNGAVFATKFLGCETEVIVAYPNITKDAMQTRTSDIHSVLNKNIVDVQTNQSAMGENDLAVYVFDSNDIDCAFTSTYYDGGVPSNKRDNNAPSTGDTGFATIVCGGSAKAEYFPVTTD